MACLQLAGWQKPFSFLQDDGCLPGLLGLVLPAISFTVPPSVLISCCSPPIAVSPRRLPTPTKSPFCPLRAPSRRSLFLSPPPLCPLVLQSFMLCLPACVEPPFFSSSSNSQKYLQKNPERSDELLYFRKTSDTDYNCCIWRSYRSFKKITSILPCRMPLFFSCGAFDVKMLFIDCEATLACGHWRLQRS